jgi:DNA polymerase III subunit alpha
MRVQNWAEFSASVKSGASAGRLAGTIIGKQERRTRTGNKMGIVQFSDATGQFEGVLFSEGLAQYRDALETGRSFIITAAAEDRPEGVSLRIATLEPLEEVASRAQKSLRIYMRDAAPVRAVTPLFGPRGEGIVSLILLKQNGKLEVEIELKERYLLSPQNAAAMKAVPGIVDVELV